MKTKNRRVSKNVTGSPNMAKAPFVDFKEAEKARTKNYLDFSIRNRLSGSNLADKFTDAANTNHATNPNRQRGPRLAKDKPETKPKNIGTFSGKAAPAGTKVNVHKTKPVAIQVTPGVWKQELKNYQDRFNKSIFMKTKGLETPKRAPVPKKRPNT